MATFALNREPVALDSSQLRLIAEATIEVCATMQGITLDLSGDPFSFSLSQIDPFEVGSCINVTGPGMEWNLAIFSSEVCCKQLVALMIGSIPADIALDDMADAFGETLNIIAGTAKRKLPSNDLFPLVIGIPQFLDGSDCVKYLSSGVEVCCQLLTDAISGIEVAVVWKEHTPL